MRKEQIPNNNIEEEISNQELAALDALKEKTKEILIELPELHGQEHTELVVHYSRLLALGEGADIFNAEMAGWTHDWGRAIERDDEKKRPHAILSGIISKDFYRKLYEHGKITSKQYGDIQRAVRHHSSAEETSRNTLKIVRDSDRLSRFNPLGIYQNLKGMLFEEGLPLYTKGRPIVREIGAPIMGWKERKSVIDGLNFCLDWERMAETGSAEKLFKQLRSAYVAFLELFSRHSDLTDEKLWVAFLEKCADEFRKKKENFEGSFSPSGADGDFKKWMEFYKENVNSENYSEKNFQDFLKEYKK